VLGALAYLTYFRLIGAAGAVVTSQVGYIVTVAGVFWGWMLFGERLGALTLPAALLTFERPHSTAPLWRAPCKGGAFQWVKAPPGEMLPPEATGATMEVTKWLKPSGKACHI
jgi:hypothetical protein